MAGNPYAIFFYVPNLIGYFRVACMVASLYYAFTNWQLSIITYSLSFFGDFFDGYFARWFNQSSTFGAVLDMVTDRCATAGLLVILSHLYKDYGFIFILLVVLDFSSHWFHMYSSAKHGHHKSATTLKDRFFLLRWYYGIYPLFGFCCVGTEFYYIFLYIFYWNHDLQNVSLIFLNLEQVLLLICAIACVLKQLINVAQLCSAAYALADADIQARATKKVN